VPCGILENKPNFGGERVNDKVEKLGDKVEKVEKDLSKFDWVTARSACSLPKVFKELRLQVEEDVKTRNALRPDNSPYEFLVAENGPEFTVTLETKDVHRSVTFGLADHAISVRDNMGNQMFEVTLTFNDEGECRLNVSKDPLDFWQVRRMALEDLLFGGY
jgi:hypothetical protein